MQHTSLVGTQSTRLQTRNKPFIRICDCRESWGRVKHLGHILLLDLKVTKYSTSCSHTLSSPPPWSQKAICSYCRSHCAASINGKTNKKQTPVNIFLKTNQTLGCFLTQKSRGVGPSCLGTIFLTDRMSRIPPQ